MQNHFSFAKINLGLQILYRYPNGYHHIVSPVAPISFADTLQLEFVRHVSAPLQFTWENFLPLAYRQNQDLLLPFTAAHCHKNLTMRTASFFYSYLQEGSFAQKFPMLYERAQKKILPFGLRIHLQKRVPSPCGLGGASSNAAEVLLFFSHTLFSPQVSADEKKKFTHELEQKALQLGSDVPLFLRRGNSLIDGVGEALPCPEIKNFAGMLAIPPFGFSTSTMYAGLKKPLQHDYVSKYSHAHSADYRDFFAHVWQGAMLDEKNSVVAEQTEDTLLLRNDFLDTAQKLFSHEAILLVKKMNWAGKLLAEAFNRRALISMSGSGSAFYALVPLAADEHREMVEARLNSVADVLKKEDSSFHWEEIFPAYWAVAKR